MSLWLRVVARQACSQIDHSTAADTLNGPSGLFKYSYQNLYFWLGRIRKWLARRLVAGREGFGERRMVANMRRRGKVYAGTSGWAYASWKPKFYPAKLGSKKFLEYYATRLNSVEVNYTFRRFLANRQRATLLPLCFQLLRAQRPSPADQNPAASNHLWRCPKCGGPMRVLERFADAAEIQLRSPPQLAPAA